MLIILETPLLHRAAESARSHGGASQKDACLPCVKARPAVQDAASRGLDGTGSARAHPHSCPRVVTLCDSVFVTGKKVNSHRLSSIMIIRTCPDPGTGSPQAACAKHQCDA